MGKRSILFNQLKYNNIIFKNEINKCKLTPSLSSSGEQILIALSIISKISVLFSSVTWVNLLPLKLYFLNINYNYFLNQFEFDKDILNLKFWILFFPRVTTANLPYSAVSKRNTLFSLFLFEITTDTTWRSKMAPGRTGRAEQGDKVIV